MKVCVILALMIFAFFLSFEFSALAHSFYKCV